MTMEVRPGAALLADAVAEMVSTRRTTPRASVAILREVPLFAGLSDRQLRKVARLAQLTRYRAHFAVVRMGTPGQSFFVILEGRARVTRGGAPPVALGPGDHFGEMALLDRRPRSATVTTETGVTALRVPAGAFHKLLRAEPTIALTLLETLSARVRELEGSP